MDCVHDPSEFYIHRCAENPVGAGGVHALVIGTSQYRYPHRGNSEYEKFKDVAGTALGAAKFAHFLKTDYRDPLDHNVLTVRLLLTPLPEEYDSLQALGMSWLPATSDRVRLALRAWFQDCDSAADNISMLYVAGHGVTRLSSSSHVFLKAEGDYPDAFANSLNLDVIKEALEYNYSQNKVLVTDCCSDAYIPPRHENGILLEPQYERMKLLRNVPRKYDPLHIAGAPRVGAKAYALGAKEGTILSYVLQELMRSAGEVVAHPRHRNDRYFAITQNAMADRVEQVFRAHPQAKKIWDSGPRIGGHTVAGGLHRPTPPPTFHVEFQIDDPGQTEPIEVTIKSRDGATIRTAALSHGQRVGLDLPAGVYIRESQSREIEFEVSRAARFDLLSRDMELL